MASSKQLFFDAVQRGSVEELKSMANVIGKESVVQLASSFNDLRETPLIIAAKENHIALVQFLVGELEAPIEQKGRFFWKGIDYEEVPPCFAAILSDHTIGVEIVRSLMLDVDELPLVLDSIMSSSIPRAQKIDVLEFVGAAYFLESFDPDVCIEYWIQAMELRQSNADGGPPIPKDPQVLSEAIQEIFGVVSEVITMEQLLELRDALDTETVSRKQALLVMHRILKHIEPGLNLFFLEQWNFNRDHFDHVINISMYVIEMFEVRQFETARSFAELFTDVINFALVKAFFNKEWEFDFNNIEGGGLFLENVLKVIRVSTTYAFKQQSHCWTNQISVSVTFFYFSVKLN